ncbi:MAG: 4-phosphoerythronate dehydrogenase [Gammaproteobacteria bacterium]
MLIVADENMPLLDAFFGDLGDIRRLSGRSIRPGDVADADVLLVRSVTRVDGSLLASASPRFVGTATIGTDHVDVPALARRGVPFSAAPGCNANAVTEYVVTVLALFAEATGKPGLEVGRLGVVGCGEVGGRVARLAARLGLECAVTDPLLPAPALPEGVGSMGLDDLLAWADIVTLHVPLTVNGLAPTWHLLDERRLRAGRWRLLVNTARGPVVDNEALSRVLSDEPGRRAVLDVWESEPEIPAELLSRVWIGTPHVAGYSAEGKWRGTAMLRAAAGRALGTGLGRSLSEVLTERGDAPVSLSWQGSLSATLGACCPVLRDDLALRRVVGAAEAGAARAFDDLRKNYPERREFPHYRITQAPREAVGLLAALGFAVEVE